jgi:phage shock protein C
MKRISVTVLLNRSTLQFEEAAYARLDEYLAESAGLLEGDPDPREILNDLEQAVADQCIRRMGAGQGVVTLVELEPALEEIGAVQVPGAATGFERAPRETARPLLQISEGAVISGVCLGLARYFGLNVTLLRVFAVLLLLLSGGGMIAVYVALMLLLPYAPLSPRAAPVGWLPAKSRELVEFLRAKFNTATS